MLKSSDEIGQDYFSIKEVAYKINSELDLVGRDILSDFNIRTWIKDGIIQIKKMVGSNYRISRKEYTNILGYTFLNIKLGISREKISSTQVILREFVLQQSEYNKYIDLYEGNNK